MNEQNAEITMPGGITPTVRMRASLICREAGWTPHVCDEIAEGKHDGYVIVQATAHIEKIEHALMNYEESRYHKLLGRGWGNLSARQTEDINIKDANTLHDLVFGGFPKQETK